jgi:hypothetical protein
MKQILLTMLIAGILAGGSLAQDVNYRSKDADAFDNTLQANKHWDTEPHDIFKQTYFFSKGDKERQISTIRMNFPAAAKGCIWVLIIKMDIESLDHRITFTLGKGFEDALLDNLSNQSLHVTQTSIEEETRFSDTVLLGVGPFHGEATLDFDNMYRGDDPVGVLEYKWHPTIQIKSTQLRLTPEELQKLTGPSAVDTNAPVQ